MKVFYHSSLIYKELLPDNIFRHVPGKACLELKKEKSDKEYDIIYNGNIIGNDTSKLDCNVEAELVIRQNGKRYLYTVRPLVKPISDEYAATYEQFAFEFNEKPDNEIESIKNGFLKMYAVDQSSEVHDWTDIFNEIEAGFSAFKSICDKPKSHLKSSNEVRPIETVKRIGYESIPYLAAHSEDWLARTASGLKPARLFSRVEDDEYQIYENRVVKTLIDIIISFLRKKEKELNDQYGQLRQIVDSSVQVGGFGFDAGFQKAVSELFSSDNKGNEHRSKTLEKVNELHNQAYMLLKRYRTLRQTRLYRYLKKSKIVTNPLNETNILLMDKKYNVIYKLWKSIRKEIIPQQLDECQEINFEDTYNYYLQFCKTLCGYTAHVLNFKNIDEGVYYREDDNLEFSVSEDNGIIHLNLRDKTRCEMLISNGLIVPISKGNSFEKFSYEGEILYWENTIDDEDIEKFSSLFKTRESRGKEQAEEKKKYQAIKSAISERQKEYKQFFKNEILIVPMLVELESENRNSFKEYMKNNAKNIIEETGTSYVIVALPKCDEDEQKITEYAKCVDENVLFLPLTMFDINSFRRMQNVMLRQIVSFGIDKCPCCGGTVRAKDNQLICDNCNQLIITKTICPNCKHAYSYLSYDIASDVIDKMQNVDSENFYQIDSLYQYKDIIAMFVEEGKLRTVCPNCGER